YGPASAGRSQPRTLRRSPAGGRLWADHHRDYSSGGILLRGGLSSAVFAQEPGRLLRPGRDRSLHAVIFFCLQIQAITNKTSALRNNSTAPCRTWELLLAMHREQALETAFLPVSLMRGSNA